jgi:catechol 2,3-dioxygenase-like lactoylglutathione lyase family enzyme
MLDHIILTVRNLGRSTSFYASALAPLGVHERADFNGNDGPKGHPDLTGFGSDGRFFLWLREGQPRDSGVRVGFAARSRREVDAAYAAAMRAGAADDGPPGIRRYYDPRYYAANARDLDGYSIEFVYKSWQHPPSHHGPTPARGV